MRHIFRVLLCLSVILLFSIAIPASPATRQIRVTGLPNRPVALLPSLEKDDVLYMDMLSFFDLLGYTSFASPENLKTVIRTGARPMTVTPLNPFVSVGDSIYQMAFPTLLESNKIYVPVLYFLDFAEQALPDLISFDPRSMSMEVVRSPYNITGVVVEEKTNGTLIHIMTSVPFQLEDVSHFIRREWLNVTVLGAKLDSSDIAAMPVSGIVKKIVPFQFVNSAQFSFLLDRKVLDTKVFVQPNEVMISLRRSNAIDGMKALDESKKRWLIDRIIIDPGHGGRDPGAIGVTGLQEKEVNLDIAQRLKRLLERNLGVEVLMTRDSNDDLPSLVERTQFANSHDGKLFISIHANSNEQKTVRGTSTYILGISKTEQALAVAETENSVIKFEKSQAVYQEMEDAAHIMNSIAQSSYLQESEELARLVTRNIANMTQIPSQGVHPGPYYVLMGAAMPRILIETAYLSNSWEEKLLRRRDFRQKVADAIYESIKAFKEKRESEIG